MLEEKRGPAVFPGHERKLEIDKSCEVAINGIWPFSLKSDLIVQLVRAQRVPAVRGSAYRCTLEFINDSLKQGRNDGRTEPEACRLAH